MSLLFRVLRKLGPWVWVMGLGVASLGQAQGVRGLGMGGLVLPGPEAADRNPAYAAYPSRFGKMGGALPLGLLRYLPVFSDTSPFTYYTDPQAFATGFDVLAFYDQFAHLDTFLLNPARSPEEVVFRIRADRLEVTDGQGNPLDLSFGFGATGPEPTLLLPELFGIPLWSGKEAYLRLGYLYGIESVRVAPSPELAQALSGGGLEACRQAPSPCVLSATVRAAQGLALTLGWAAALPGQLYVGVRGQGFYGFGYAELSAKARPLFNENGSPMGVDLWAEGTFISQNRGYGLRGDVGVVWDLGPATLGLGVQNLLGLVVWEGTNYFVIDQNGPSGGFPFRRSGGPFAPVFFLNGAYRFEDLGLLVGADASFGSVAPSAHLGVEYALGSTSLRAGVGYEGGLRFGLGVGLELEGLGLDLALTRHEAPLVGGGVYGLALAMRF